MSTKLVQSKQYCLTEQFPLHTCTVVSSRTSVVAQSPRPTRMTRTRPCMTTTTTGVLPALALKSTACPVATLGARLIASIPTPTSSTGTWPRYSVTHSAVLTSTPWSAVLSVASGWARLLAARSYIPWITAAGVRGGTSSLTGHTRWIADSCIVGKKNKSNKMVFYQSTENESIGDEAQMTKLLMSYSFKATHSNETQDSSTGVTSSTL